MTIRAATTADAEAIAAIYAPAVATGTGTFEIEPPGAADMAARISKVLRHGWPWLVHETMGVVDGFAYASQFRDRAAYAATGETSIYVAPQAARTGIGRALLAALLSASRDAGFRQMIAVIGDSGNTASIRLHESCGFAPVGVLREVGRKFGRDLDIVLMQRTL